MTKKEFNEKVRKVLGIKSEVVFVMIEIKNDDHLNQRVSLGIIPSKYQAKKLRVIAHEFGNVKPI